jgi:hypothetical protein
MNMFRPLLYIFMPVPDHGFKLRATTSCTFYTLKILPKSNGDSRSIALSICHTQNNVMTHVKNGTILFTGHNAESVRE